MSDDKNTQLEIYGRVLTGQETDLEKESLLRANYLKGKLRRALDLVGLGDEKDISTDLAKSIALGAAIQMGLVADQKILDRYKALAQAQLALYGGPEAIISVLEEQSAKLADLLGRYYGAKMIMAAAKDEEAVRLVDIEPPAPKISD